jgi:hypothetical protein
MKQKCLRELFENTESCYELDVAKYQCLEEIIKLIGKVFLVCILFWILNFIGKYLSTHKELLQGNFDSSILFSVFVLPLLYSLKDVKDCFGSLFVKIWKDEKSITVKRGILWIEYDKLYLDDLNNIEMYQSPGGRIAEKIGRITNGRITGYCSMTLYAVCGVVSLLCLKDTDKNRKVISELMEKAQKN